LLRGLASDCEPPTSLHPLKRGSEHQSVCVTITTVCTPDFHRPSISSVPRTRLSPAQASDNLCSTFCFWTLPVPGVLVLLKLHLKPEIKASFVPLRNSSLHFHRHRESHPCTVLPELPRVSQKPRGALPVLRRQVDCGSLPNPSSAAGTPDASLLWGPHNLHLEFRGLHLSIFVKQSNSLLMTVDVFFPSPIGADNVFGLPQGLNHRDLHNQRTEINYICS
jgi:hypothetical protein